MKHIVIFLLAALVSISASAASFSKALKSLNDPKGKHVLVVAHRGDWRNAPENSLPAFRHCIDMGVDMVELDLQKTRDGHLVIMHDFDVNRTTNGKGRVCDLTLDEIKQLRLKNGMGRVTTVQVPTLEEVFALTKGKILINVDKGYDYFGEVYELACKMGMTQQIVIKSGHRLDKVRRENTEALNNSIYMPVVQLDSDAAEQFIDEWATIRPVAIECCFSKFGDREKALVKKIASYGIKVWINSLWASLCAGHDDDTAAFDGNVNDSWQWLLDNGATIIQTDRPAMLIRYLKKKHRHK